MIRCSAWRQQDEPSAIPAALAVPGRQGFGQEGNATAGRGTFDPGDGLRACGATAGRSCPAVRLLGSGLGRRRARTAIVRHGTLCRDGPGLPECRPRDLAASDAHRPAAARIQLEEVRLCNNSRFPVFRVALPYAVDGPNDGPLNRLYADLARANGFWSYALVDTANAVAITVTVDPARHTVSPRYEDFRQ
jgi:hypothetical protein